MNKPHPLSACRAARVPIGGLAALAPLRAKGGVHVVMDKATAWVSWDGDRRDVVDALLAVPGVEWFESRDGRWFGFGSRLPTFDVPPGGESIALARALVPAPFAPAEADARGPARVSLRLVRCEVPHPATALRCQIEALRPLVDKATTAEITRLKGARCGDVVWLLGHVLPAIPGAERFWGERVLVPLGFRADPDWPESALREAAGVGDEEILVLAGDGADAIPVPAFRPLARAALRRATFR
jgi:MoxR-vWA-beta-propeller ternary system domain bpX2